MPGWYEATRVRLDRGDFKMVGIIQEQHPERARLFMQWKRMNWPILVDALDRLEVSVVPITLLIDEYGRIAGRVSPRDDPAQVLEEFLSKSFAAPEGETSASPKPGGTVARPADDADAESWRRHAESLALWGGDRRRHGAIDAYREALRRDPDDGWAEFRLGVAYRARYDSDAGSAADFRLAVEHWSRALELDPNNYIWRRRLQQFGPRLDKPYPFYDWVDEASEAIAARGESAVELPVQPRGAELARPAKSFQSSRDDGVEPDAAGKIHRDPGKLIRVVPTLVPVALAPGKSARVHLEFRPDPANDAHWNNEVEGLVVWVDPPEGFEVDRRKITLSNPAEPASHEPRRVEFEVKSPAGAAGQAELSAYALYYVCEGEAGPCLYRRQEIIVPLPTVGGERQEGDSR